MPSCLQKIISLDIIEAATMLKKDNMNFKIIFIGDGPETEEYKKL